MKERREEKRECRREWKEGRGRERERERERERSAAEKQTVRLELSFSPVSEERRVGPVAAGYLKVLARIKEPSKVQC